MASRFLIEFVTAQPPTGVKPLSDASYENLLAISHHITNFGFSSDLLHLGLADTASFSSRLRADWASSEMPSVKVSRPTWRHTHQNVGAVVLCETSHVIGVVALAMVRLVCLSDSLEASKAEFGATLAEFFDVMMAAVDIPRLSSKLGRPPDSRASSVDQIATTLSWPTETVAHIVDSTYDRTPRGCLVPEAPFKLLRDV